MKLIILFIAITYKLGHNNIKVDGKMFSFLGVYKAGFFFSLFFVGILFIFWKTIMLYNW